MRVIPLLALATTLLGAVASAQPARSTAEAQKPKEREYSYIYDMFHHSIPRPVARWFDFPRIGRRLTGNLREAYNVDDNDQVRMPSTWWQPRIGFRPVTVAQMMKGPGPGLGPAPGSWTITKAKTQGVSPGFQMKDSKGVRYIVKFDPPELPDLATSVDVIGSYLFWGAGYNVPENTIAYFKPADLQIDDEATVDDAKGRETKMTRQFITDLLGKLKPLPDGRYRCIASRFLAGKPLGPFKYQGRRTDDPEDLIPHELRRELRGLWAIAAWTNHTDIRGPNSLDMWVEDDGRSFVRHYLIDFGSILGSSAVGKRSYASGTEYYVDYKIIPRQIVTVGLAPFAWEDVVDPMIKSVGFVEGDDFDPGHWKPDYPNPAFDERTERDIRWGVRIVSGFTDDHIRAAVAAAKYSDPRASEYITQVLIKRRDKLVARWLDTPDVRQRARLP